MNKSISNIKDSRIVNRNTRVNLIRDKQIKLPVMSKILKNAYFIPEGNRLSAIGKYLFILFFLCGPRCIKAAEIKFSDTVTVIKIWDKAGHQAFTDLIRFRNAFYCSFREGESHVAAGSSGKIRVLKSKDGSKWESIALLEINNLDLRDPKLSVTPDNKLMITLAGAVFQNGVPTVMVPMSSFSDKNGMNFSVPVKCVLDPAINPTQDWIWRVTWYKGVGYGVNYQLKENAKDRTTLKKDAWVPYLMKTTDGINFQNIKRLDVEDLPNESTLRFDKDGKILALIRREAGDRMGVLAESRPPYKEWTYKKLSFRLGGPNFIFLDNKRLLIGTRIYDDGPSTGFYVTDLQGNTIKTLKLPSSGDTSYPGMLIFENKLWTSYYSSHEGKTSIYLAKIPLDTLLH
jgi:hypothetical protein